uniref:Uncharacterized protein n=1 Tax=Globisporangium ultimum (strain ATCC 200006 / CBS 805.95 / DAOM BR144) TaxID=431595 RepID=K3W834_GLOUD
MNWENYGSDREETAQLAPSTENEIVTELQAVASKRRRERLALGITVLLSAAVVSGVVLHSSRRTAVIETTLVQTGAQVSAFRSEETNFGIEEGKTIKCGEDDNALYRMSNNERHYYPSTEIAAAWDSDWQNPVVADCTDIPQGADMSYPSDTMDKSATDAAWSPATPSDPPVSGPYDILDENEAEGSELEPSGQSESQPEEMQPEEMQPEESEPEAIMPDTTGPEYSTPDTSGPEYSKAEYTNGTEPEGAAPDMTSPDTTKPQEFEPTKDSLWQPHEPTKTTQWEPEGPAESTEWEPKNPSQSPLWDPKEPAKPWETVEPLQYEPTKPVEPKTWDSVSNTFEPAQYEPKPWGSNAPVAASYWKPAPDQKPVEPVPFFKPVPEPNPTESTSFWQPPIEQKPANYAPQPSWPAVPAFPAFPANGNNYQAGSTPQYPSSNYQNGNAPQYPPSNNFQTGNPPQYTNAPLVVGKELTPAEMKKALEDQVKNLRAQAPGGK